jgi:hypothetical protein
MAKFEFESLIVYKGCLINKWMCNVMFFVRVWDVCLNSCET